MSRIFTRSPYIVEINETGQESTRIELYIWNEGTTEPTSPQYNLSKNIPASNLPSTTYNVSPFIREYISFSEFDFTTVQGQPSDVNQWANVRIKTFYTNALSEYESSDTLYTAFDGFGTYEDGYNPDLGNVLLDEGTYYYKKLELGQSAGDREHFGGSLTVQGDVGDKVRFTDLVTGANVSFTVGVSNVLDYNTNYVLYRDNGNKVEYLQGGTTVTWTGYFKPTCENKYTPVYIDFVNNHGAWTRLFMFKTSKEKFAVTSSEYNLMQSDLVNYSVLEGQRKQFNVNGQESIKTNSGWVSDEFGNQIKQLLVSERILVNNRPAKCMTTSLDIQKSINDKTMSYSLDFQFNNDYINSVV